jgi:plasmid segregation protein ParM
MIGIDHGYAAIKTAHFTFPSGLVAYEHEPYSMENVLEYDGLYYVIGSERQPLQKDKTKTENYYLLTLAAIAKELEYRGAEPNSSIILAAGLPLTSFGRDKKPFRKYLLRDRKPVSFHFEGKPYSITISDVQLFPQGYAAALTQRELLEEPSVIVADLGGWTVDLMRIDNHIPNAATCRSLELGMIRCLDEISEQVRRSLGLSLTSAQLESALRGDAAALDKRAKEIIRFGAEAYVSQLLSAIQESGLDYQAMPTIFLGGGAALLKRHLPASAGLCRPFILDDVSLNAKGFERLCGQLSSREKNG